jgi:hypothetical protein
MSPVGMYMTWTLEGCNSANPAENALHHAAPGAEQGRWRGGRRGEERRGEERRLLLRKADLMVWQMRRNDDHGSLLI